MPREDGDIESFARVGPSRAMVLDTKLLPSTAR